MARRGTSDQSRSAIPVLRCFLGTILEAPREGRARLALYRAETGNAVQQLSDGSSLLDLDYLMALQHMLLGTFLGEYTPADRGGGCTECL